MRRREFIALLSGPAIAWPLSVVAQSPDRKRKIGVLWGLTATDPEWSQRFGTFRQALQELGWAEGKDFAFEIRHAVGKPDQLPALAVVCDLVCDSARTRPIAPAPGTTGVGNRYRRAPLNTSPV